MIKQKRQLFQAVFYVYFKMDLRKQMILIKINSKSSRLNIIKG